MKRSFGACALSSRVTFSFVLALSRKQEENRGARAWRFLSLPRFYFSAHPVVLISIFLFLFHSHSRSLTCAQASRVAVKLRAGRNKGSRDSTIDDFSREQNRKVSQGFGCKKLTITHLSEREKGRERDEKNTFMQRS